MENEETQEIKCASCGFLDSGRYCSNCGAILTEKSYGIAISFIESFLKLGEFRDFVFTFFKILRSPTRTIISLYENGNAKKAFEFLAYSLTIYVLIALSRIWVIKEHDLVSTIIFTLQFLLTIFTSTSISFKITKDDSTKQRTFHDFLVISSYYIGVNIILIGIATSIQLINLVVGTVVMWLFLIPIMIYTIRVLKYFWGLGTWAILWRLSIGSFAGGVVGLGFLLLCGMVFNIQIQKF